MPLTKTISVKRPSRRSSRAWETLPGTGKIDVMEIIAGTMTDPTTFVVENVVAFHIGFVQGISRGCRVLYLGKDFEVRRVSDSSRLRGLEILCSSTVAQE